MAQKSKMMTSAHPARFPQEAYDYNDDVKTEVVAKLREERAVDVTDGDEWELVDGFGQVVYA